jgi:hypothetical protein
MSFVVQDVYDRVVSSLLEPSGLTHGLCTDAQFLELFSETVLEFLQRTRLSKAIFTQTVFAGQSDYIIPDKILFVEHAFIAGAYIEKTNQVDLDAMKFVWRRTLDIPLHWYEDGLPIKQIGVYPAPSYTGVLVPGPYPPFGAYGDFNPSDRNLTTVGAQSETTTAWNLGDTVTLVPDSAAQYLAHGVLRKILSGDNEQHDAQRSLFSNARFEEGVALWASIMREELEEDSDV